METKFTQFLRFGGNGEFQFRRDGKSWVGNGLSIKSEFPNYAALRERFAGKLNEIITSNTAMLLQSVGAHYDPPLTAENLPDVGAVRADTLALWEERIEVIWAEWHSHPQRLRPIREAMEQHLLRGFTALINELRQRGLGIRRYVWRSRDDGRVRSAHAAHDDQFFTWDNPPEGGIRDRRSTVVVWQSRCRRVRQATSFWRNSPCRLTGSQILERRLGVGWQAA
jgi:hypothetical protein